MSDIRRICRLSISMFFDSLSIIVCKHKDGEKTRRELRKWMLILIQFSRWSWGRHPLLRTVEGAAIRAADALSVQTAGPSWWLLHKQRRSRGAQAHGLNKSTPFWPVRLPWACQRGHESRSRKSAQDDKWSFCLTAGTLCPANQERPCQDGLLLKRNAFSLVHILSF